MRCPFLFVVASAALVFAQDQAAQQGTIAQPSSPPSEPTQPLPTPKLNPKLKLPDLKFQTAPPNGQVQANPQLKLPDLKFQELPDLKLQPAWPDGRVQANPQRCAIPLLEMKPPQEFSMPLLKIPPSASNDRIAVPPPAPACPPR